VQLGLQELEAEDLEGVKERLDIVKSPSYLFNELLLPFNSGEVFT